MLEENLSKGFGYEGVVAPWCNPLTLQLEQLSGVDSIPGRTPPHERHDKGSGLDYVCSISAISALGCEKRNFTFTFTINGIRFKMGYNSSCL